MKFLLLASAVLSSLVAVKADDPSAVLSSFWPAGQVPSVTGSALTGLASGLASVESSWTNSPQYTSVQQAIFNAAPSATRAALSTGYDVQTLTAAPWFSTGVPDSAKSAIASEQAALDSVAAKFISISSSKAGAAPAQATGMVAVVAAAAMGAVGVLAAL